MATSPVNDDRFYFSVTELLGIGFTNSPDLRRNGLEPLAWREVERVAELNHKINSPLAAIRNALYLASRQCSDPQILRYLAVADQEVSSISRVLEEERCAVGELVLRERRPRGDRDSATA